MLANFAVAALDNQLYLLASEKGLIYTRYADDLTFSTQRSDYHRGEASSLIRMTYDILRRFGFSPNIAKTRIVPPGGRKVVLGLLVDRDSPRLPREFKARLRQHIHYMRMPDPAEHARRRGFTAVAGLRNHLQGLVAFATQIEPEYGHSIGRAIESLHGRFREDTGIIRGYRGKSGIVGRYHG